MSALSAARPRRSSAQALSARVCRPGLPPRATSAASPAASSLHARTSISPISAQPKWPNPPQSAAPPLSPPTSEPCPLLSKARRCGGPWSRATTPSPSVFPQARPQQDVKLLRRRRPLPPPRLILSPLWRLPSTRWRRPTPPLPASGSMASSSPRAAQARRRRQPEVLQSARYFLGECCLKGLYRAFFVSKEGYRFT